MNDPALLKINRGSQAQALLENSLLQEALSALEQAYTAAWRAGRTLEAREDCHRYIKLIEKLKSDIQSIANTGALEQARINQLEGQRGKIAWLTAK